MSLRLIVAIALVASALSAPTWTKQLTILSSSADTVVTNNCACNGCEGAYNFTQGENWHMCKTTCEADCNCVFAMFDEARANPQLEFNFGAGEVEGNRRVGNISTTGDKAGYDCSHLIHSAGGTCVDNDANGNGRHDSRTVEMVKANDYSIQDSLKADCRTITGFTISGQGDVKFKLTHDINGKSMQIQRIDGQQWSGDLKLSCPRGNPNNSSDYHLTTTACWHYDIQSVDPRHPGQARPQAQAGSNANFKCAAMPSAGTAQGHPCGGATCGACPTDSPTPAPSYAPSWHTERPTPAPSAR